MEELSAFWNQFTDIAPDAGFKMLLAIVLAGLVGLEREFRGRPAGLRTHILVCLGATLMMIVSELIAQSYAQTDQQVWLDSGRIAAGVITGVGFLGAGTIINRGGSPHGLTTAAMIWFVAAVGVAIGADYHSIAVLATFFAIAVVVGLRHLERHMIQRRFFRLRVELRGTPTDFAQIESTIQKHKDFKVSTSRLKYDKSDGRIKTQFQIEARSGGDFQKLMRLIQETYPEADTITIEH